MSHIVIICEGSSDEAILKVLFQKEKALAHITPWFQPLGGETRFKRKEIRSRVCNSFKKPGVLAVFALIDLKGASVDYPTDITSYIDKARFVKDYLKGFLSGLSESDKFYPHVAVHDIETWILADRDAVAKYFRSSTIPYQADCPEAIDFNRPPSYILGDLFKSNGLVYIKTVRGPELFKTVNFNIINDRCPHLRDFIDDLKRVAKEV